MRRIMIVAALAALAQTVVGFSPMLQTFPESHSIRRIQVTARTIAALFPGRSYVVDLTQRGVVYEFSPQAGRIDFDRVKVRTARGEVTIAFFMETTILKDKLAGTVQNPPTGTTNFQCAKDICNCAGTRDCSDLIFNSSLCGGHIFCATNPVTGEKDCTCRRD
jgi:hypothetical protein